MIALVIFFLIIAVVAAIFGFGGLVAAATDVAIILFWVFLAMFLISLLVEIVRPRRRRY